MKNFIQEGNALNCVAPEGGVISGSLYIVSGIPHVASTTAAEDEEYAGWTEGVYELPAAAAAVFDQFDSVYFDEAEGELTDDGDGNPLVGVAAAAKAADAVTAQVKLLPRAAAAPGVAVADIALAAVAGVDGVGNNAASKADVDARFTTVKNKINEIIASLEGATVIDS